MEKKIWHNVGKEPDLHSKIMLDNGAVCSVEQWSAKVAETHKWAYVSDLLNLSNVQRTVKNWNESVSEDLEEAAIEYCGGHKGADARVRAGFLTGAMWQKEHILKPADGDDLPEIDKEVIVLTQPYPLEKSEYAVSFAHRPNPNGWDGKSVTTGKVEHYTPKTYGKGGWNHPDVKWWLDVEFPKE